MNTRRSIQTLNTQQERSKNSYGYGKLSQSDLRENAPNDVGEMVRVNHTSCGDMRRRLYLKRISPAAVLGFCHNCQSKGVLRTSVSIVRSIVTKHTHTDVSLPKDVVYEIPLEFRAWLYSLRFDDKMIRKHKIMYSPSMDRIIVPLHTIDGEYIGWAARSNTLSPKWLYPKNMKKELVCAIQKK